MKCYFDGWNFWAMLVISLLLVWEWYLGRYGRTAKSVIDLLFVYGAVLVVSAGILITLLWKRKSNDGSSNDSSRSGPR